MKLRAKRPQIKKEGKIYSFRLTVGVKSGKPHRKKFKYKSYKEAQLGLNELMSQKLNKQSDTYKYSITLKQAKSYYLQQKANRGISEKSVIRYREYIDNFLTFLSDKRSSYKEPSEVDKRDIEGFMHYEKTRGLAPSTINEQITFISDLYETLIDNDYLEKNPVRKRKHKIRANRTKPPVTFSEKEVNAILEHTKGLHLNINWFEFYLTAYLTGLRRNELRELTWNSVFLNNNPPYIHIYKTKTGTPKTIPIHPELYPYFKNLEKRRKNDLVFPNFNGKILPSNKPTNQLKSICKELNISKEKAHLHTFRRTFASLSKMKGLDSEAIQKIGGWKDRNVMESHYVNLPSKWAVDKYFEISYLQGDKNEI